VITNASRRIIEILIVAIMILSAAYVLSAEEREETTQSQGQTILMRQSPTPISVKANTPINFAWDAPVTGSAPTGYTITVGTTQPVILPATARTYTYSPGVPPASSLTVTLNAFNEAGSSPNVQLTLSTILPGAPQNFRIVTSTITSMKPDGTWAEKQEWRMVMPVEIRPEDQQ
jgi:hypothetical protein